MRLVVQLQCMPLGPKRFGIEMACVMQKRRREAGGRAESSGRGKGPRLYAAKNEAAAAAFKARESLAGVQSLPLADRLAAAGNAGAPGRQRWATFHCAAHSGILISLCSVLI